MNKLTVKDLELKGQRVLTRVDFNVPLDGSTITSAQRIEAARPTMDYILEQGGSLVLMSHLGRPKGSVNPEFSLAPVAEYLRSKANYDVNFVPDCVGDEAEAASAALEPAQLLLLENLRFHPGEQKPESEPDFAERLARHGQLYVNDAFGTAHRAHASMVAVAQRFERPAAGFLMAKEIEYFSQVLDKPKQPFVAILGGAKVSDKILVMQHLLGQVDALLVGGAMAFTFLAAQGKAIGSSRVEEDRLDTAREIMAAAKSAGVELHLPLDHVCGREFAADTELLVTENEQIGEGWMGLDVGPKTRAHYSELIAGAQTVVWNGPMGVFEWDAFAAGTMALAKACAASQATTIVGGGDSASAAQKSGLADQLSHISTGGGASLELLEGKELPGLAVLADR